MAVTPGREGKLPARSTMWSCGPPACEEDAAVQTNGVGKSILGKTMRKEHRPVLLAPKARQRTGFQDEGRGASVPALTLSIVVGVHTSRTCVGFKIGNELDRRFT